MDYQIKLVSNSSELRNWMAERHYSGSAPTSTQYAFELLDHEKRLGLIFFGPPSRKQAVQKYEGYIELTRLWIDDVCPKNTESYLIGWALRWLKKNTSLKGVLSYADPNVGHRGVIYRASNFKFDGKTAPSYHYTDKNGFRVHIRQVWERARANAEEVPGWRESDQAEIEGLTRVDDRGGKHRFIYDFRGSKAPLGVHVERDQKLISFFSQNSREKFWVLGLLIGDGNVFSDGKGEYRVSIVGNENTIQKVQTIVPASVGKPVGKNKKVREWYVNSKALVQFFSERGLIGKKKDIENLWPNVDPDFRWDFLRGLIDSDGSFIWEKRNGHTSLLLGFSSANKKFCQTVLANLDPDSSVDLKESVKNQFRQYSFKLSQSKSLAILEKIYDCPESIRNEERFKKYLMGIKLHEKWMARKCTVCGEPGYDAQFCFSHLMQDRRISRTLENNCSVDGCQNPYHGDGFCMMHFWEVRNSQNPLRNEKIGLRIKELRVKAGISQLELSRKVLNHKGNGHLSNVEKGASFTSMENVILLANYFGVSKEWVLFGTTDYSEPSRNGTMEQTGTVR